MAAIFKQRPANRRERLARAASHARRPAAKSARPSGSRNCWRRSSSPATGSRSRATTRSRRISSRRALAKANPARLHDLHMVQSVLALPDHLAVFERGIANRLDFAFAGPQSRKLAELVAAGSLKIGAIHTYLELYARMLVDLTPRVALVVADKADREGNLYTGPNTEDTPVIAEATAFNGGIVVAQVNEIVDTPAARRHPGGLGRCRRAEPGALRDRAAVHARSRQNSRRQDIDGDDGDRRRLRAL